MYYKVYRVNKMIYNKKYKTRDFVDPSKERLKAMDLFVNDPLRLINEELMFYFKAGFVKADNYKKK